MPLTAAAYAARFVRSWVPEAHCMSTRKHSKPATTLALAAQPGPPALLAGVAGVVCVACLMAGCGRGHQARGAGVPAGTGRHAVSAAKEVEIQEDPVKTGIEAGDASLAGKVRARLAGDPQLRLLHIEVDAEAGRVTLWGSVGRAEERTAAEQQARRTPGVSSVINLIKVAG